ncbi:cation-translocating P-type ATPase [Tepidimonas charontis]|uniref:Putative cation-transporting ATPase F n=1 Tax=Tepidimonas charontis TaxID=2267262 RepID=A0A554XK99_9BURK|nr:HAD-IC family P-type ATPase [Tepidimonas charontis]TSE36253.1 putative cation-transporting ATPase F [Tepidimonas charontis]
MVMTRAPHPLPPRPAPSQTSDPASSAPLWHALPPDATLEHLGSHARGLSAADAAARLLQHGENRLREAPPMPLWRRVLRQFDNLLIWVLLVAAAITVAIDHVVDAAVIVAVVLLNVTIGLVQEGKAERALAAIRRLLAPQAHVWRDGHLLALDAAHLVPGDVIQVNAGDNLPADVRWLSTHELQIDESALTGESVPVSKHPAAVAADAALGDRRSMGYAGTLATAGQGVGVVVATGMATEVGRIGQLLQDVAETSTPLVRQMAQMGRWITLAVLAAAALLFGFGWGVRGLPALDTFMAAVGLAVAAIPEGLPAIMTVTLAIGVQRMAQQRAIVRRLPAVETLGCVTVICSDKTGTLTRNEMTVQQVVLAEALIDVEGVGYAPTGALLRDGAPLQPGELWREAPTLLALAEGAALCNDAELLRAEDGHWQLAGDPTEGALLTLAMKAGLDPQRLALERPRTAVLPFESSRRYMATAHRRDDGSLEVWLKGAPERVLALCTHALDERGQSMALQQAAWEQRIQAQAALGRRVLAMARGTLPAGAALTHETLPADLALVGLVGIIDPPREEARAAIALCQGAGIRVTMITGDHALTAQAIARALGLRATDHVLTGADIEAFDEAALRRAVRHCDVFARAAPEHKLRLVRALQAHGEVVAMTGDGVNDAPALKAADVGVAMGQKGTEAAQRAAAMVLTDDNFATIARAVREGRTVYDNLRKVITFLLPINGGESVSLLVAVLLGLALPIAPVQILWVNMVSSIALAAVLAFEPTEADVMRRPPRPPKQPMLTPFVLWRIALVSALFAIGIFGVYRWALDNGHDHATAQTLAVNTLVAMEVFYLFSVRYLRAPSFTWAGVQGTPRVLLAVAGACALQALFTYTPFMHEWFGSAALSLPQLALCAAMGVAVLAVLELEKAVLRRWRLV